MGNCWSFCSHHSLVINKIQNEIKLLQKNHPQLAWLIYDEDDGLISDHDAIAIATALRNNVYVQTLIIHHDVFPLEGYYALSKALEINKSIQIFDIDILSYDSRRSNIIAETLRRNQTSFQALRLFSTDEIPVISIVEILNAVSDNTILETLYLRYKFNYFTSEEIILQLGQALGFILRHNKRLARIDFDCLNIPSISDIAIQLLVTGLQANNKLKELSISAVSNEGVLLVANALRYNTSLRSLNISCHNLRPDVIVAIFQALETNETLDTLFLWGDLPELNFKTCEIILHSLQFNDTLTTTSLTCAENDSYNEIVAIIESNRSNTRTALKKGSRKRYCCTSWLLSNLNEW